MHIDRRPIVLVLGLVLAGCKPAPTIASFAELDYGLPVETADVAGDALAYVDVGEGPQTLVLIHGLGSYIPAWSQNIDALAASHRVIAIDLPGFGRSDKPNAPYSMRYFVAKVRGLLQQLGVQHPVLVGHSMGGQIAITYALAHPDEVGALVLTSPAGLETFEDGEAKWLANAVTPEFTCLASDEAIFARHVGNFHAMPEQAEFMVRDRIAMKSAEDFPAYCVAVSRSVAGMIDDPVHSRLSMLEPPVLVLFGKNDGLIPNPFLHGGSTVRLAEQEVERIRGAQLEILPRAGHMAQFEQAPAWNARVLAFVDALPPPPGPVAEPAPPKAKPTAPPKAKPTAKPEPEPEPEPEGPAPAPEGPQPELEGAAPASEEPASEPQP